MDQEIPDYDMDSDDEQWLTKQAKNLKMEVTPLKFENMMDRLEKGSGQTVSNKIPVLLIGKIWLLAFTFYKTILRCPIDSLRYKFDSNCLYMYVIFGHLFVVVSKMSVWRKWEFM